MDTTPATTIRTEADREAAAGSPPPSASPRRGGERRGGERGDDAGRPTPRRRLLHPLPLLALLVAAPLLYLGMNHFAAALLEARHAGTVASAQRHQPLSAERLDAAIAGLEHALEWRPTRETHFHLAQLQQARAELAEAGPATRRSALDAAIAHYRAGLALAPLSSIGWSRLAWLLAGEGHTDQALAALRLSTLVGPYAPLQRWWRLELWLRLFRRLEPGDLPMARRQLAQAFDIDPWRLARLASRHGLLFRVRSELARAGVARERLDVLFPVPLVHPRKRS